MTWLAFDPDVVPDIPCPVCGWHPSHRRSRAWHETAMGRKLERKAS